MSTLWSSMVVILHIEGAILALKKSHIIDWNTQITASNSTGPCKSTQLKDPFSVSN